MTTTQAPGAIFSHSQLPPGIVVAKANPPSVSSHASGKASPLTVTVPPSAPVSGGFAVVGAVGVDWLGEEAPPPPHAVKISAAVVMRMTLIACLLLLDGAGIVGLRVRNTPNKSFAAAEGCSALDARENAPGSMSETLRMSL